MADKPGNPLTGRRRSLQEEQQRRASGWKPPPPPRRGSGDVFLGAAADAPPAAADAFGGQNPLKTARRRSLIDEAKRREKAKEAPPLLEAADDAPTRPSAFEGQNPMKKAQRRSVVDRAKREEKAAPPEDAAPPPPPPPAAPPPPPTPSKPKGRWKGENPQQFALVAHNMACVASVTLAALGLVAVLWAEGGTYACKVRGKNIAPALIRNTGNGTGTCVVGGMSIHARPACCDPDGPASKAENLGGSYWVGAACLIGGVAALALESTKFGLGLWMPTDWAFYRWRLAPQALWLGGLGVVGCFTRATLLGGFFALCAALGYELAFYRKEAGDGGRSRKPRNAEPRPLGDRLLSYVGGGGATTLWVFLFFAANATMFVYTLAFWVGSIRDLEADLLDDTLKLDGCASCPDPSDAPYTRWRDGCALNKAALRNGPLSYWAALAKAAGVTLNFDCALLIVPVTRTVLVFLNELGGNHRAAQRRSALFSRYFSAPLAKYLPLAKHVDFHKLIAGTMAALAVTHTACHLMNYWLAPRYTVAR